MAKVEDYFIDLDSNHLLVRYKPYSELFDNINHCQIRFHSLIIEWRRKLSESQYSSVDKVRSLTLTLCVVRRVLVSQSEPISINCNLKCVRKVVSGHLSRFIHFFPPFLSLNTTNDETLRFVTIVYVFAAKADFDFPVLSADHTHYEVNVPVFRTSQHIELLQICSVMKEHRMWSIWDHTFTIRTIFSGHKRISTL